MHDARPHRRIERRRPQIAFIVGTLGRGGAERQLVYMLNALKDHAETRVLCLTKGEPLEAEITALGVPVQWVGHNPSWSGRIQEITKAVGQKPADIVQSTHFFTNLYAFAAGKATGARSVGAVRSNVLREIRGNPVFGYAGLLLPDYLIVNSRPARERAIRRGCSPNRVVLIRNAVDVGRFRHAGKEYVIRGRRSLRLLCVGRLIPEKRVDRFLRVVKAVDETLAGRSVEARIVGGGPERYSLETLRSQLDLDVERVRFLGEVDDTASHYQWADMLVLTSDQEGTPNVVLEAMAAGLPVVATSVGGVPDLLCHGGGLMAPTHSEQTLARAICRLAEDQTLTQTLVEEGRRYVDSNHSLNSLATQLLDLYGRIGDTPVTTSTLR